jgi:hypothetical protein
MTLAARAKQAKSYIASGGRPGDSGPDILELNLDQDFDFFRHPRAGGDPGPRVGCVRLGQPSPESVRVMASISRTILDPRLRGEDKVC